MAMQTARLILEPRGKGSMSISFSSEHRCVEFDVIFIDTYVSECVFFGAF